MAKAWHADRVATRSRKKSGEVVWHEFKEVLMQPQGCREQVWAVGGDGVKEELVGACLHTQPALWGERDTWHIQKTEATQRNPGGP